MKSINLLQKDFRDKVNAFLAFLEFEKIAYTVLETLRTAEVQSAYYAQGREPIDAVNALREKAGLWKITPQDNLRKITWTLDSKHLSGLAIDVAPIIDGKIPWIITKDTAPLWIRIGELGEKAGLSWGGRWDPVSSLGIGRDAPHFEVKE